MLFKIDENTYVNLAHVIAVERSTTMVALRVSEPVRAIVVAEDFESLVARLTEAFSNLA